MWWIATIESVLPRPSKSCRECWQKTNSEMRYCWCSPISRCVLNGCAACGRAASWQDLHAPVSAFVQKKPCSVDCMWTLGCRLPSELFCVTREHTSIPIPPVVSFLFYFSVHVHGICAVLGFWLFLADVSICISSFPHLVLSSPPPPTHTHTHVLCS